VIAGLAEAGGVSLEDLADLNCLNIRSKPIPGVWPSELKTFLPIHVDEVGNYKSTIGMNN
jgi:hypothetical protein